ncbi:MAG TPA: ABC transporter substrate-binding protein [Myxococcota bacterium]|nr:ABC transporter substrate-binding protein [Myxococcota bacterium]
MSRTNQSGRKPAARLTGTGLRLALLGALLLVAGFAVGRPFRYAEDRSPGIVNPLFATTMSEARLNELVFEGLYADNLDLASEPRLALSDEIAPDGRSMVIRLRKDVSWHDGMLFTANDVVYTIAAMLEPRTASSEASRVAWIESVQALDDHTVSLTFREPQASPRDRLHFKILPSHLFDSPVVDRSHPFRNKPIGTGPFQLTRFNTDSSITLTPYPGYGRPTGLTEIQMREVVDKTYQSRLLLYGSMEALVRVLPRDLATLQAARNTELYPYQTNSWWYMGFNLGDPRFTDPRVREAMSLMIDRQALMSPIGTGDLLSGPFVRSSPFYNHDVKQREPDLTRAQALLREAGWTWATDHWERGGQPLELRLTALARQETAQDVVINLQSQLRGAGVVVRQEFLNSAEWKERVWGKRDFDLILSQWSFDRNEDIYEQFHTSGNRNFVGFTDAEVDRLLDEARTTVDPQRKRDLLRATHARVASLTPMVFLWTLDTYAAMSVDVQNVTVHPFYFFTWATSWYLP